MKKIVAFGDSWTQGHGVEDDPNFKEVATPDSFIYHLRMCNSWVRWLADKFKLPFVNISQCGIDNTKILEYIKIYRQKLTADDIVLIMWSYPYRHLNKEQTKHILLEDIILEAEQHLQGLNYFFISSFVPTFKEEPDLLQRFDSSKWIDIEGCAADVLNEYERINDISVWEYNSRKVYDEHSFSLGDYHPNLFGYQILGDYIYNKLHEKFNI